MRGTMHVMSMYSTESARQKIDRLYFLLQTIESFKIEEYTIWEAHDRSGYNSGITLRWTCDHNPGAQVKEVLGPQDYWDFIKTQFKIDKE